MKFDYNLEMNNILNKIYQHKICQIALKNNFSDINDENKNYCLDINDENKNYCLIYIKKYKNISRK